MNMRLLAADRQRVKAETQRDIDAATRDLEHGLLDERAWSVRQADALAEAYLLDEDPRWQSGFDGDAELWREARELILAPVHRDGTLLDIGCATGHLMECLEEWASERGHQLEVYGLELSPKLVSEARHRLPRFRECIFQGNILDWVPRFRFSFVRTSLEYVPASKRAWLVQRLRDHFLEADGRVIVGPVTKAELSPTLDLFEKAQAEASTAEHTDRNGKIRYIIWSKSSRARDLHTSHRGLV